MRFASRILAIFLTLTFTSFSYAKDDYKIAWSIYVGKNAFVSVDHVFFHKPCRFP
ncbi:MAG: hypothetical protein AAF525_00585 [Pseudomonadota bacterium]